MTKGIDRPGSGEVGAGLDAATRGEVLSARRAIAFALVAVLALVSFASYTERRQVRERENERAESLARAFEFHVHHELQNIDDLLRQLGRMRLETATGFHTAVDSLRAGELGQRTIDLTLLGADGRMRHTTARTSDARHDRHGDREYFRAHLANGPDRLFVSRPSVSSLYGPESLEFSRRYVSAAGEFLGVIVLTLPHNFLTDGARALGLRADDVATILRQDGFVLSRMPLLPDGFRSSERLPAGFIARFDGPPFGLFEDISPVDQLRRLVAYRRTTEFPVVSIVAPSTAYRDLELRKAIWRHLVLAAMVSALLIAFHVFHERSLRTAGVLRREQDRERRNLAEAQAMANLGSWRLDMARHVIEWSAEARQICGLPAGGKATGIDDFLALIPPDDRVAVDAAIGRAREEGLPYDIRHCIVRPDGTLRHLIQRGQVEIDQGGRVKQFFGTIQDVTEALEGERRLLEAARADRVARAVFDGVMQPMLILSNEGRLVEVNPAFEDVFAVDGKKMRGLLLTELERMPQFSTPFSCRPSRLFQHDTSLGDEASDVMVTIDHKEHVLALNLSGVRDASGQIERYVGIYTDVTERRHREDSAVHQSRHDQLTGLPNRQYALERLSRSINRAQRKRQMGVVIFIDLDHFKEINDTYGHEAGDEVLRVIALRFQAVLRQQDMIARLGGDEFVALIEEVANREVVTRVAEAIRVAATEPIPYGDGIRLSVSASLGVAAFPRQGELPEALLKRADHAMYEAKSSGRDAVCYFAGDHLSTESGPPTADIRVFSSRR